MYARKQPLLLCVLCAVDGAAGSLGIFRMKRYKIILVQHFLLRYRWSFYKSWLCIMLVNLMEYWLLFMLTECDTNEVVISKDLCWQVLI